MTGLLRRLYQRVREARNRTLVDGVGTGTRIPGTIDRRARGAVINVGRGCLMQGVLVAERDASRIEIGNNSLVGGGTTLDCALSITVEDDVLISYGCTLADSDNHSLYPEQRGQDLANWMDGGRHDWSHSKMAPIRVCRGAWVGARSIILKGVTVGAGAVVAMGSVVTRDVPPRTIVAGNPAKIVGEIGPCPDSHH
jgi:acetyltransferase-like isoleucine patch superfamily enzyme